MRNRLEQITKILIYLTFLVPLIVMPSSFIFPFIVPKILAFRIIVEIMLGLYILLLTINWEQYRPRLTTLNLVVSLFFLSFTISTFTGVDAYHSFWDNHERMLGLFTLLHFYFYYLICTAIFKNWTDWKKALRIFLLAGSVVMFIALLQKLVDPNLVLNQGSGRVISTLGNSIYLGGYGLFLLFVGALLFLREDNIFWKWGELALAVLAALAIFWSGTRGSILGLLAGIATAILAYVLVLKEHKKTRIVLVGVAVLGLIAIGLLYAFRTNKIVANLPAIGRAVNTSWHDVTSSPRWLAWEIAVRSWSEKPVFGWGPNNYFYAFNKYYNPQSLEYGYGETWFDNAHNIILNTLAVQGAFGLLTYLAIFICGGAVLVVSRRRQGMNNHVFVIGLSFLMAHLIQNITVFENPTSYLYFVFWLAMINQLVSLNNQDSDVENKADKNLKASPIVAVGVLLLIVIFVFNIQPARANSKTLTAIRDLSQDPISGLSSAKEALAFNSPHIDDIRADISRTISQVLVSYGKNLDKAKSEELFNLAYSELEKNILLHPLDIRSHLLMAQLDQNIAEITQNAQYILKEKLILEEALMYSPRRQQIIYSLASVDMQLGDSTSTLKLLEQAINDDPIIAESYWRLAYMYKILGNEKKAEETLALAEKNGVIFSDNEKNIVNEIRTKVKPLNANAK